jgi:Xaa-Pro aminopeptidase
MTAGKIPEKPAPLLLYAVAADDPDFRYATGFGVEQGLYLRFDDGDDLLSVSALEVDRARTEANAARIVDRSELAWQERHDVMEAWAETAARQLLARGIDVVRVSPLLPAAFYDALQRAGIRAEIDKQLFHDERRRKSDREIESIRAAQRAAEAATVEVIRHLAAAREEGGYLVLDGNPLTSEWLMARAQAALNERGCGAGELIVAGSPEAALPHFRGAGPLRWGAPVVIDIFPRHQASGYHGDLTRTVVPGLVSSLVEQMHAACVEALDAGIGCLESDVDGRQVHRQVCQVLVDRGFGSVTPGLEGDPERPRMVHSTGHGVGLEVHEAPALRNLEYPLRARDVVTVEPGLYQVGLGGVRVEDLLVVTESGSDNLTTLPRSLNPADYL